MLTSTFAVVLSVLGLATASPLTGRQNLCNPNFEGAGLSVVNNNREWHVSQPIQAGSLITSPQAILSQVDFRFEQTGQPVTTYIAKVVDHNELVVAPRNDGKLGVANINANDPTQIWKVACRSCGTGASNFHGRITVGCTISSASSGQCVQIGATPSDPPFLTTCNGSGSQSFDFWTSFPN